MSDNKQKGKKILDDAISHFWKDYGRILSVRGRHTHVKVEPKFIVGNRVTWFFTKSKFSSL